MDADAYAAAHSAEWDRLGTLAARRRLDGESSDELIAAYQSGATQLSDLSSSDGDSAYTDRLATVLARSRQRFTGARSSATSVIARFFAISLPAALYRVRWVTLFVALATVAVASLTAWWLVSDPRALAQVGTEADLKQYLNHDFIDYYSRNPAASFAGQVWTNNAWLAAQSIATGILGVYVPYILLQNAVNVGVAAGIFVHFHRSDVLFSYILPHGMLELTSLFVAAAAGLRIFWAWIAPGPRTRGQALAQEGRALFAIAVGTAISLFCSGLIEGFVTPSPLPVWLKIAIGALALAAFLFYMLVIGRRAALAGETGDLEADAPRRLVAA
ncbi:stage II sporulation protein M [Humibacter ginsenosidimutans]|uniref:Stage II sporulation protein M n=1 Tax=Humibacter ginsenosidimutans TaxID=2599293 RepID=A0A5B8M8B5_9MICO|nr:stage II sporulation protein M [Humibacter ginsenosidimutans]QDZ16461.1 stage II sporulation protein M [Humibacter ginsenosidimutans]